MLDTRGSSAWTQSMGDRSAPQLKLSLREEQRYAEEGGDELGLGSVSREQTERRTLEMVSAGLQLSLRMSRQMAPELLMLQ
jgi:hypothetical protein